MIFLFQGLELIFPVPGLETIFQSTLERT